MSNETWKKENTVQYGVRILNSSGIPDAMNRMMVDSGKTRNAYIIEAIREKLIRDGYLQEGAEK